MKLDTLNVFWLCGLPLNVMLSMYKEDISNIINNNPTDPYCYTTTTDVPSSSFTGNIQLQWRVGQAHKHGGLLFWASCLSCFRFDV